MIWKLIALCKGWRKAYDVETNDLVVFNERLGLHYVGRDAWYLAATYRKGWAS